MHDDPTPKPAEPTDVPSVDLDADGLKDALGRTGRMLKTGGLPFEEEEFDANASSALREEAEASAAGSADTDD